MDRTVFLSRCDTYDEAELLPLIDRIFEAFHLYDRIRSGMTVVLKPNLIIRAKPEDVCATHPAFVAAVGKCVQKAGAKVLIAESPGGPYTSAVMKAHFKACGYTEIAEANGFALYTDCKSRDVPLPQGALCRQAAIVEPFLERDFLIDLAKLKTHSMTGFSGAVKNLFGVVPGLQKPELHCRFPEKEDFAKMLVDLCDFVKPDFCLIDGIWAMEGDGPTGGTRRDVHAVIGANDPFAADVCATSLIGIDPMSIPMLRCGRDRGLCPAGPEELTLPGDASIESLRVDDFRRARAASTDFLDLMPGFLRPLAKKIVTPYPRIDRKGCIGCGKCAESCPQHTIAVKDGKAEIDYKNCIRCFCCHEMCPRHVIDVKRFGLLRF